ncbi:MAG TPA: hypothetical protein EYP14_03600, partial [Planctomycetaceae bacterium]|nr:hypothetical protein [Planctomycetaceae bacterium]
MTHKTMLRWLSYAIFLGGLIPLIFGGKVYNSLRVVMSVKLVTIMVFLLTLAVCFSRWQTWTEIFTGFFKFGQVPVSRPEDANGNGRLDPGEDWDGDGHLDVIEPSLRLKFGTVFRPDSATDVDADGRPDPMINLGTPEKPRYWPDLNRDGQPDAWFQYDIDADGEL